MLTKYLSMVLAVGGLFTGASVASAQVSIRVPFVRVETGGGYTYVRAPFVRVFVPRSEPVYPYYVEPAPAEALPAPMKDDLAPPKPLPQPSKVLSIEEFAKTFKAQPGNFAVMVMNPVTKEPTEVRFSLPEGRPTRVDVRKEEVEFVYGPRQFVRIHFDRDGAMVTSR